MHQIMISHLIVGSQIKVTAWRKTKCSVNIHLINVLIIVTFSWSVEEERRDLMSNGLLQREFERLCVGSPLQCFHRGKLYNQEKRPQTGSCNNWCQSWWQFSSHSIPPSSRSISWIGITLIFFLFCRCWWAYISPGTSLVVWHDHQ